MNDCPARIRWPLLTCTVSGWAGQPQSHFGICVCPARAAANVLYLVY